MKAVNSPKNSPFKRLTKREFDVFLLLGKGDSDLEAAKTLFVSAKTIASHRSNIFRKMGFKDRYKLIYFAVKYEFDNFKGRFKKQ